MFKQLSEAEGRCTVRSNTAATLLFNDTRPGNIERKTYRANDDSTMRRTSGSSSRVSTTSGYY